MSKHLASKLQVNISCSKPCFKLEHGPRHQSFVSWKPLVSIPALQLLTPARIRRVLRTSRDARSFQGTARVGAAAKARAFAIL